MKMDTTDGIKIVLWDLGNVLIQGVHKPLFDLIFKMNNATTDRVSFDRGIYGIINESFYGRIGLEDTWRQIQTLAAIDDELFAGIRQSVEKNNFNQQLISGAMKLTEQLQFGILSDLSQIGYSVAQSNISHFIQQCERERIFISISHGLTKLKDGNKFFTLALKKMNTPPQQVLLIDDSEKSVETAKALGMRGVVFRHSEYDVSWDTANAALRDDLVTIGLNI